MSEHHGQWKYISYVDLSNDIKKNLHKIHIGNYDLIVGVPRSGMIPAYMIALYLNVHITDLTSFIDNKPLEKGQRLLNKPLKNPHDAKNVLLVDDTIATGSQMKINKNKIPVNLKSRITYLAVYASNDSDLIDIYLKLNGVRRLFEWNLFHREYLKNACVDIDGVLCSDPTLEQDDDNENYIDFIKNVKPIIIPSYEIHSIVTNRLEKYRSLTEEWLSKHHVRYKNLIMLNVESKKIKYETNEYINHKANYFANNDDLQIFIESNKREANQIIKISGKPVLCIDENKMIHPGFVSIARNNPIKFYQNLKLSLKRILPNFLKKSAKKFFFKK